jgi:membrane-bound lytic murein transglycosylase D
MLDQKPFIEQDESVIHIVKSGEYLGKIADKYNTTINKLMIWNNLSKTNLKIGQKLVVYKLDIPKKSLKKSSNYIVKKGDTLWGIAQQFQGISVVEIKKLNNIISNTLKPGTIIKIPKI